MKNLFKKKNFGIVLIILTIFAELFIFNFKHWESLLFPKITEYQVTYGSGLTEQSPQLYKITDPAQAYIEFTDVNAHIDNVYLDIDTPGTRVIPVQVSMTDRANSMYYTLPVTEVVRGVEASHYLRMHLSGNSEKLKVSFNLGEGTELTIQDTALNAVRPLIIEPLRIIFLLVGGCLFYLFRPSSALYQGELDIKNKKQRAAIGFVIMLQLAVLMVIGFSMQSFKTWTWDTWRAHAQYEDLADSLIEGHVYLNEEPPEYLKQMENPYDTALRNSLQEQTGEKYLFDFAYYNGKYYCYFGIVPAILFFVPFKLLTGMRLHTWIPVLLCGLLYCPLSYTLIYQLSRKFKLYLNCGLYILLSSAFMVGSAMLYLIHFGNVYSMPIMLGLCLGVAGMVLWLKAKTERGEPRMRYLLLGSICMALVIGCRMQLAVAMFMAFPIFWTEIKERYFFSKKGFLNTCCVIVPFLIIGSALGYYNYIRFGSPFDFGATYNLTSNDMTHKGFMLSRNLLGIFEYLLQPLNIKSTYPFMANVEVRTAWQGYWSMEPLLGGWLWYNLLGVFALLTYKYRRILSNKKLLGMAAVALFGALMIVEADLQMSGLTQRYMSDFGWLFILAAIIVVMTIYDQMPQGVLKQYFLKALICISVFSIFINCFSILMDGRYASIRDTNALMFYTIKYMFFTP